MLCVFIALMLSLSDKILHYSFSQFALTKNKKKKNKKTKKNCTFN